MVQEHFGISVVEMMAAGVVTLAHDSAGPKMDIIHATSGDGSDDGEYVHVSSAGAGEGVDKKVSVGSRDGYLASTAEEYVACLQDILEDSPAGERRRQMIRDRARRSVRRFDDSVFEKEVVRLMQGMM